MKVDDKLSTLLPLDMIEPEAQRQMWKAHAMSEVKKIVILPDVHAGYEIPIGSVVLLDDMIWPAAVGYDIGCGMCHANIGEAEIDEDLYQAIVNRIPTGFTQRASRTRLPEEFKSVSGDTELTDKVNEVATRQLGTLGGGNHFIEVGLNPARHVGITIHSGSRRAGYDIADYYMKKSNMKPIPVDSDLGMAYLADMKWAEKYALANRNNMMLTVQSLFHNCEQMVYVNENHNHATVTPNGILHRKGATPAEKGKLGIIPANMRDGVFITEGLGNEDYLSSASHGAGRVMSRTKAKKTIPLEVVQDHMKGIQCPKLTSRLDEAPQAYKNIDVVLSHQDGVVVNVVDHFKPLIVVKG